MTAPDAALVAEHLTVRYGGRLALDGLSFAAPAASITGLIGPNGAGKTTTFNALTGVVASEGTVRLGELSLDGRTPVERAQLGLGRTFQRVQLFDTMTVTENASMGRELLLAGRRPWRHAAASRRERVECADHARGALERCGIAALSDVFAGDLSTGQRRLVELARAIATEFRFLLLDEPSSGLDQRETSLFAEVLVQLAADDGVGILLVEHDMSLVRATCSHLHVLDFGRPLLDGPAQEVLTSDLLRDAYLGADAAEIRV